MDRRRVAVVIPAFNEAGTIATVVEGALAHGRAIVVDDGSLDETSDRASAAGAEVVRHEESRGYDGALNSGFQRAFELGSEYVITMDADGQHDPAVLGGFLAALDDGADLVVGIRPTRARLGERLFAWVVNQHWGLRDPLCGQKGYRIGLWKACGHFDSYRSIGTELSIFAASRGARIVQIPVPLRKRNDAPRFGSGMRANARILRALIVGIARAHSSSARPQ